MKKSPAIKYLVALLIAGGALYLAFRKQQWSELVKQLHAAHLSIILLGTGVMFLSHLVRAWRYKMFLRPIAPHTRLFSAFKALIAGYAMNNIVPRSGDIVRPVLFSKRENIPIASSVAVLLIERLTDLIGLSAILIFALLYFNTEIGKEFPAIATLTVPIVIVLGLLFVLGLLLLFSEKKAGAVIRFLTKILPARMGEAIEHAAVGIEAGLKGVRSGSAVPVILGTLGITVLYTSSMYISTLAFPSPELKGIGFVGCFLLQTMSGLAFTMPTPGGTGTYHYFISQALSTVFGVPLEVAIAFATLTHASNYLITTITGLGFMFSDGITMTTVRSEDVKKEVLTAKKGVLETGNGPGGLTPTAREAIV